MCDHCRTYKPLLEGADAPRRYEERPKIIDKPPSPLRADVNDRGCCSWRQSCCNGGCCDRVGNCCSSEPETRYQPAEKPALSYGYHCGQPALSSYSVGMADTTAMPDRVPCTRQEKKLPMCFGGDCQDTLECKDKPNGNVGENYESESIPRQSER